eukprot:15448808-Alexandrium_andersonii.AAC.1
MVQHEVADSLRHEQSWRFSRRRSAIGCGPGRSARLVTTPTCTSEAGSEHRRARGAGGEAWAMLRALEAAGRWAEAAKDRLVGPAEQQGVARALPPFLGIARRGATRPAWTLALLAAVTVQLLVQDKVAQHDMVALAAVQSAT